MELSIREYHTRSFLYFSKIEKNLSKKKEEILTRNRRVTLFSIPKFEASELDEFTSCLLESRFPATSLRHTSRVGTSAFLFWGCEGDTPKSRSRTPPCQRVKGLSRRVASELLGLTRGSAELF